MEGNRDQNKRAKMGKIADLFSDKIYLTDDNPRLEQPSKIRKDIKKGIKKHKVFEFPNRAKAICRGNKTFKYRGNFTCSWKRSRNRFKKLVKKKFSFQIKKLSLMQ